MTCRINRKHTIRFSFTHFGSNLPIKAISLDTKDPKFKEKFIDSLNNFLKNYDPTKLPDKGYKSRAGLALRTLRTAAFRTPNFTSPKILSKFENGLKIS